MRRHAGDDGCFAGTTGEVAKWRWHIAGTHRRGGRVRVTGRNRHDERPQRTGSGASLHGEAVGERGGGSREAPTGAVAASVLRVAGSREPGAGSREPGAGSREPGAGSREPGAGSREPGAGSREPGAGSREPGAGSREPGAGSREPGAGSREPGAGSREPGAGSQCTTAPGSPAPLSAEPLPGQLSARVLPTRPKPFPFPETPSLALLPAPAGRAPQPRSIDAAPPRTRTRTGKAAARAASDGRFRAVVATGPTRKAPWAGGVRRLGGGEPRRGARAGGRGGWLSPPRSSRSPCSGAPSLRGVRPRGFLVPRPAGRAGAGRARAGADRSPPELELDSFGTGSG